MGAIGYIRVSTEEQAREGVSLDNQKARIESYCEYKGFDLDEIIEDAGISGGKNKARPGFIDLLDRIESGEVRIVVLYSLERLSRDMLTLLALERLLDENGPWLNLKHLWLAISITLDHSVFVFNRFEDTRTKHRSDAESRRRCRPARYGYLCVIADASFPCVSFAPPGLVWYKRYKDYERNVGEE